MVKTNLRVLAADDRLHSLVGLRGLPAALLRAEVIAEADNGQEAVRLADERPPDAALMDLRMEALDGLAARRLTRRRRPEASLILLPMYPSCREQARIADPDDPSVGGCQAAEFLMAILNGAGAESKENGS